jgi:hypothetical protein
MNIVSDISIPILVVLQLCFYALSILFHEIGHWIWFNRRNIESKLMFSFKGGFEITTEKSITKYDYKEMLLTGILFGIFPLVAAAIYNFFFIWLFIPYLLGCGWDIREYKKIEGNE